MQQNSSAVMAVTVSGTRYLGTDTDATSASENVDPSGVNIIDITEEAILVDAIVTQAVSKT
ncbi:hypothetical protein ABE26_09250 [Cytobacillus firmus]|nr:hypothetical protein [Cytobacillus firmus]